MMKTKKIGLFGGTFDPIHFGHTDMAHIFVQELNLDQVIFIPTGQPYHKNNHQESTALHRFNMCHLAIEKNPLFSLSDIDIKRAGATYTYDTVQTFKVIYPNTELWWLMGSDSLSYLHQWYRYGDLIKSIHIAVALRHKKDLDKLPNEIDQKLHYPSDTDLGKIIILNKKPITISSTTIRHKIINHEDVRPYLDPKVIQYIHEHQLYLK